LPCSWRRLASKRFLAGDAGNNAAARVVGTHGVRTGLGRFGVGQFCLILKGVRAIIVAAGETLLYINILDTTLTF